MRNDILFHNGYVSIPDIKGYRFGNAEEAKEMDCAYVLVNPSDGLMEYVIHFGTEEDASENRQKILEKRYFSDRGSKGVRMYRLTDGENPAGIYVRYDNE